MGKVLVLTTGGTISTAPDKKNGLLQAGAINGLELFKEANISLNTEIDVMEFRRLPGNHLTLLDLFHLKEEVENLLTHEEVDGIVITHGTDTLEETAYFLNLVIDNEKPIVITGSLRSLSDVSSDAPINLLQAVQVAASSNSKRLGVLVVFNETIFSAQDIQKVYANNISGFSSFGYGKLGIIDKERVIYYRKPFVDKKYKLIKPPKSVDMISCFLGMNTKHLECSINDQETMGIILEGFGRGQVPPVLISKIKEAWKNGKIVVITSRTLEGHVYPVYNYPGSVQDSINNGAVIGEHLNGKQARLKLAILLSIYGNDRERITKEFYYG